MKTEIVITIPEYVEKVQLSNKARKKFFEEGKEVPKKYDNERYVWKNKRLYDTEEKQFVAKNPVASQRPRFTTISGNEVYARMHERIRMKIVNAIKDDFRPHLPKVIPLKFPLQIRMELYASPRLADWDVDNLWIYTKCFQDLLVQDGLLPDDNIRSIVGSGGIKFIPIADHDKRVMKFFLQEAEGIYSNHVLYNKPTVALPGRRSGYLLQLGPGKAGSMLVDESTKVITAHIGVRNVSQEALSEVLNRTYYLCMQSNTPLSIRDNDFAQYEELIDKYLTGRGIPVTVLNHN